MRVKKIVLNGQCYLHIYGDNQSDADIPLAKYDVGIGSLVLSKALTLNAYSEVIAIIKTCREVM